MIEKSHRDIFMKKQNLLINGEFAKISDYKGVNWL